MPLVCIRIILHVHVHVHMLNKKFNRQCLKYPSVQSGRFHYVTYLHKNIPSTDDLIACHLSLLKITNCFIFFRKITRQDLVNYISTHYTAPRIVLAGAGNIDHDELVKLAEKSFSGLPGGPTTLPDMAPCRYTGCEVSQCLFNAHIQTIYHIHVSGNFQATINFALKN